MRLNERIVYPRLITTSRALMKIKITREAALALNALDTIETVKQSFFILRLLTKN